MEGGIEQNQEAYTLGYNPKSTKFLTVHVKFSRHIHCSGGKAFITFSKKSIAQKRIRSTSEKNKWETNTQKNPRLASEKPLIRKMFIQGH